MHGPEPRELVLRSIRRALGLSVALFAFYLLVPLVWAIPPMSPTDVIAILVIVFAGVWLGVGFSTVWPMPAERGLPRAIRTVLLAVPALGFGMAIQVSFFGARANRAYFVMFALAAWLGSVFIKEDEDEATGTVEADAGDDAPVSES